MTKEYRKFLAFMILTKQFKLVYIESKPKLKFVETNNVLTETDLDFLYSIYQKKMAATKQPFWDNNIKPI
jgi:hypothetical protein